MIKLLTRLGGVSGQAASRFAGVQVFWTHMSIDLTLQDHPTGPLKTEREKETERETERWKDGKK